MSGLADGPGLVSADRNIRFYAGCPLSAPNGRKLGTLCVIDSEPWEVDDEDIALLEKLGQFVEEELAIADMMRDDPVTGLSNGVGFSQVAEYLLAMSVGPVRKQRSGITPRSHVCGRECPGDFPNDLSVTSVLLENIVVEFDELGIHAMDDAVSRSRDGPHHFVDELRILVDDFLEIVPFQAQDMARTKRTQPDRVLMAIDEAEFAGEVALAEHRETGHVSAAGTFDHFQFALEKHVQCIVTGTLIDQELTIGQFAGTHDAAEHAGLALR